MTDTPAPLANLVEHHPNWLNLQYANDLLRQSGKLDWLQNEFSIYGKTVNLPRQEAIYGDDSYVYSYSRGKVSLTAKPWPQWLDDLRDIIERETGYRFPLVIGNYYADGRKHIGWHDDGRPELGDNPAIASISLGGTRTFQVRRKPSFKGERTPIVNYELGHGDLVIMHPGCQEDYQHKILKTTKVCEPRVNWTFRPWIA